MEKKGVQDKQTNKMAKLTPNVSEIAFHVYKIILNYN